MIALITNFSTTKLFLPKCPPTRRVPSRGSQGLRSPLEFISQEHSWLLQRHLCVWSCIPNIGAERAWFSLFILTLSFRKQLENPYNALSYRWENSHCSRPWQFVEIRTQTSLSCIGEGNGNPLQCACLESPRDGEPGGLIKAGFRKGRGTRDQIPNTRWIMEKAREFQKNIYF